MVKVQIIFLHCSEFDTLKKNEENVCKKGIIKINHLPLRVLDHCELNLHASWLAFYSKLRVVSFGNPCRM